MILVPPTSNRRTNRPAPPHHHMKSSSSNPSSLLLPPASPPPVRSSSHLEVPKVSIHKKHTPPQPTPLPPQSHPPLQKNKFQNKETYPLTLSSLSLLLSLTTSSSLFFTFSAARLFSARCPARYPSLAAGNSDAGSTLRVFSSRLIMALVRVGTRSLRVW